ncbi:MAG TPA: hypothetical protein DEF45_03915, partial [Rhodopirellula sp.]|nr:hypothetical protein [Rhodopirellula sp.]
SASDGADAFCTLSIPSDECGYWVSIAKLNKLPIQALPTTRHRSAIDCDQSRLFIPISKSTCETRESNL